MSIEGLETKGDLLRWIETEFSNKAGIVNVTAVSGLADQLDAFSGRIDELAGDTRTVWGVIDTEDPPTILSGSGDFAVVNDGVGEVTITFDTPFDEIPAVNFTPGETAGMLGTKHNAATTTDDTQPVLFNIGTVANVDGVLHFTATGPA